MLPKCKSLSLQAPWKRGKYLVTVLSGLFRLFNPPQIWDLVLDKGGLKKVSGSDPITSVAPKDLGGDVARRRRAKKSVFLMCF